MQSEDRLIHFATELVHTPRQHEKAKLQKLYYELTQTSGASYDSNDFSQMQQVRFVSKGEGNAHSALVFLPDRMIVLEEWAEIPLSDYLKKVSAITAKAMQELGIDQFIGEAVTLRSTFALTHFEDARPFLMDHACQQADKIAPFFRRPIGTAGLRFMLPATAEHPGDIHVIIESFRLGKNEVFVEVKGVFRDLSIDGETLHKALEHIQVCRSFISDNVFPFLNQYDTVQENAD